MSQDRYFREQSNAQARSSFPYPLPYGHAVNTQPFSDTSVGVAGIRSDSSGLTCTAVDGVDVGAARGQLCADPSATGFILFHTNDGSIVGGRVAAGRRLTIGETIGSPVTR
jgi:hypothetical protein